MATPQMYSSALPPSLDRERREILLDGFLGHVAVISTDEQTPQSLKAREIAAHLQKLKVQAHWIRYDNAHPQWLDRAKSEGCTHFVFVGIPPARRMRASRLGSASLGCTPEEEYMAKGRRKLNDVVVVQLQLPSTRADLKDTSHYLERFLQLDGNLSGVWLAEAALALFAGPDPKACEDDYAYWSSEPKLVSVWREGNSLGLSIMTREMANESEFRRIVLIKGFNHGCVRELQDKLGKYTHVQSVSGIFLDGLTIERVTEVFRSLKESRIQLLVRYIHPKRQREFPTRVYTRPTKTPKRVSIDFTSELLPIPLFVLGDSFTLRKELFKLLKMDDVAIGLEAGALAGTPHSVTSPGVPTHPHLLNGGVTSHPTEKDNITPIENVERVLAAKRGAGPPLKELAESDDCIERAEISMSKFEIDPTSLPDFDIKDEPRTPMRPPPEFKRQVSTRPLIADKQYVLHMLKQNVDRRFAHLFFKSSGLYLIAVGLDDFVADPLIQYDNLFYWLRLIHTHVQPEEIKRVIVIGMYKKKEVQEQEDLILQCVQHLNVAIRDHMKQNYVIPMKEKGFVFMFDLNNPVTESQYLCACIKSLTEVFVDQAWYFKQPFFETVFTPFEGLRKVCISLAATAKHRVVLSAKDVKKLYAPKDVPDKYFQTLAAYSSACISTTQISSLLRPSLIPTLLFSCTEMNHHEYQVFTLPLGFLKGLPVVSAQLLRQRMVVLGVADGTNEKSIIEWMKTLDVIYSLGKRRGEEEKFFVPFLATEALSDKACCKWDQDRADELASDESLVLYALLPFHATEQFFHRLIASLLADAVVNVSSLPKCYINLGCKEAMLPLPSEDLQSSQDPVLLKYHRIQNIIEFRTGKHSPLLLLKAVEAKLSDVFQQSPYYPPDTFKAAASFHIPSTEFSQSVLDSPVWKLGSLRPPGDSPEDEGVEDDNNKPEKVLLKTKLLSSPGNMHIHSELKAWASSDPAMKKLPPELFLRLQKLLSTHFYWADVASKLALLTTEDIEYYSANIVAGGNGGVVLQKWRESSLTYRDLVRVFREIGLSMAADKVEKHFLGQ